MTKRQRRIRTAFLTGLTWAFVGVFVGTSFMVLGSELGAATDMIGPFALMGLIGGGAFSLGRRRLEEMSLPRFAGLGAVGGLLLGVLWGPETLLTLSIATLLGAGSVAGSLALARRAGEMSLPRFAAWAVVVGILLSIPWYGRIGGFSLVNVVLLGIPVLMCAGWAAASLALARRADDGDLLEAGESAGLIEGG